VNGAMARRAQWRSFAHAKCDVDDALATTFALAKSVEVAVPRRRRRDGDDDDDDDAIARALDDAAHADVGTHYEAEMSIADALDAHFVHEHVRRWTASKTKTRGEGATFGLTTIDAEIDSDDCFCVTPKGRFVASLMADARESLGLQTTEDARGKALASVNLCREEFKVGNWFHDRIGACARAYEQRTGKTKVLCAYVLDGTHEEVKFPRTVTTTRRVKGVKTSSRVRVNLASESPMLLASACPPTRGEDKDIDVDALDRIFEFCGRMSLGNAYMDDAEDDCGDVVEKRRWRGLMLYPDTRRVIDIARSIVNDGCAPWAVVTIWTFEHMPSDLTGAPTKKVERVSCAPKTSDVFTIVLYPGDKYLKFVA
jgi:hypothetical protein